MSILIWIICGTCGVESYFALQEYRSGYLHTQRTVMPTGTVPENVVSLNTPATSASCAHALDVAD